MRGGSFAAAKQLVLLLLFSQDTLKLVQVCNSSKLSNFSSLDPRDIQSQSYTYTIKNNRQLKY